MKKLFRVLVCGGRYYANSDTVFDILDEYNPDEILEGGCATGADSFARTWAQVRERTCITVYAKWKQLGNYAGPERNERMLGYNPDCVVAFPGGPGTADMVRKAKAVGLDVAEIT